MSKTDLLFPQKKTTTKLPSWIFSMMDKSMMDFVRVHHGFFFTVSIISRAGLPPCPPPQEKERESCRYFKHYPGEKTKVVEFYSQSKAKAMHSAELVKQLFEAIWILSPCSHCPARSGSHCSKSVHGFEACGRPLSPLSNIAASTSICNTKSTSAASVPSPV